jgi:hypothetical protein
VQPINEAASGAIIADAHELGRTRRMITERNSDIRKRLKAFF